MLIEILAFNPRTTKEEVTISLKGVRVGGVALDPEVVVGVVELEGFVAETLKCRWRILNLPFWPFGAFLNDKNCWIHPVLIFHIISNYRGKNK